MEAKDTVMSPEMREMFRMKCHEDISAYLGVDIPDVKLSDMDGGAIQICRDVAHEELKTQADISFREGMKEVVRQLKAVFTDMPCESTVIGTNLTIPEPPAKYIMDREWRAKLKEWGIE